VVSLVLGRVPDDEGESDVPLDIGEVEPGDADGDRECGAAQQMETG
jgi:hypothetical protein